MQLVLSHDVIADESGSTVGCDGPGVRDVCHDEDVTVNERRLRIRPLPRLPAKLLPQVLAPLLLPVDCVQADEVAVGA